MNIRKYCEYFNINETYFPCIDESAINAGVDWQATYPHETFIKLMVLVKVNALMLLKKFWKHLKMIYAFIGISLSR